MYRAVDASTSGLLPRPTPHGLEAQYARDNSPTSSMYGGDDPYHNNGVGPNSMGSTTGSGAISDKFSLSADPKQWGSTIAPGQAEPDDYLHNPVVKNGKVVDSSGGMGIFTFRGMANLGCLFILVLGLLTLFVGFPIISYAQKMSSSSSLEALGVNSSGQVPEMTFGNWGLIDVDTPDEAYYIKDWRDNKDWQLVFSDEFNVDGRSFYPGDDPYWEALDLHYWGTNNMEWYDPSMITTKGGELVITLDDRPAHELDYMGGMMSSWNQFCFTGGYVETSVTLPGISNVAGLWPAIWTMGNLGRAGHGASLDGMWPYTYDACDVGTAPNQTIEGLPEAALIGGQEDANFELSYLPGQRLSRCTCPGESHPGPKHKDGSWVGRAAPEIDIFEAQSTEEGGEVSQSSQFAPFNNEYVWFNTSDNLIIEDLEISKLNSYLGGKTQQAMSVVSLTNQDCYQLGTGCKSIYGFQYMPGYNEGYISWINDGKLAWTLNGAGAAADPIVEIAARPIPQEPLYILMNLGMSENFGAVDLEHLTFPATMTVDYVRVYQDPDHINIGCDPKDFPTQEYINTYYEAYTNPNMTTWVDDFGQVNPKNSLVDGC